MHSKGSGAFEFGRDYAWQDQLYGLEGRPLDPVLISGAAGDSPEIGDGGEDGRDRHFGPQWVYLRLSQPATAPAVRPGTDSPGSVPPPVPVTVRWRPVAGADS